MCFRVCTIWMILSQVLQDAVLIMHWIQKQNLWLGGKDTISKIYDGRFKEIFATIYEDEFKEKFEAAGIEYFYSLIDDIVARVIRQKAVLSGHARTITEML